GSAAGSASPAIQKAVAATATTRGVSAVATVATATTAAVVSTARAARAARTTRTTRIAIAAVTACSADAAGAAIIVVEVGATTTTSDDLWDTAINTKTAAPAPRGVIHKVVATGAADKKPQVHGSRETKSAFHFSSEAATGRRTIAASGTIGGDVVSAGVQC